MNTKHTPGPWMLSTVTTAAGSCHKIGPFPSKGVYNETYACVYADNVRPGEEQHSKIGAELLANARLITAAPRLFVALNAVIDCFQKTGTLSDEVVAQACEVLEPFEST